MSGADVIRDINKKKREIGTELVKYRKLNATLTESNYQELLKENFNIVDESHKKPVSDLIFKNIENANKILKGASDGLDNFLFYARKYFNISSGGKLSRKRRISRGGKWSAKYKRSIDCKRPKGFSQRQHCKYGRKTKKNRIQRGGRCANSDHLDWVEKQIFNERLTHTHSMELNSYLETITKMIKENGHCDKNKILIKHIIKTAAAHSRSLKDEDVNFYIKLSKIISDLGLTELLRNAESKRRGNSSRKLSSLKLKGNYRVP